MQNIGQRMAKTIFLKVYLKRSLRYSELLMAKILLNEFFCIGRSNLQEIVFFIFQKFKNLNRINDFYNYLTLPVPLNSLPFIMSNISILFLFYQSPWERPKLKNELDYLEHDYNDCELFAFEIKESLSFE